MTKLTTYTYDSDADLRRGPWTLEEDNLLIHCIACHGEGRWNSLAKFAGLKRTGKSCRLRWLNYLKPDIKRGNLTPHEQLLILELHSKWGNRWSKIAQNLPGRTDNEIKNYWRTRVQKQARQLKVDSNSHKFLEAIRTFWMPRLMEKADQTAASTSSSSENPNRDDVVLTGAAPPAVSSNNSESEKWPYSVGGGDLSLTGGENPVEVGGDVDHEYYQEHVGFASSEMGGQSGAFSEWHVAGGDWFGEELGSTFWNTDELWRSDEVDLL